MSYKPRRRKKKLVKSRLQLHLIAVFSSLACLSSLFQVLVLNRSIVALAERSGDSPGALAGEMPTILFGNLALTLAVLLPLMLVVGVLVTHRIAGPVFRFEEHLGAIARGEDPGICRIRKGDELHELCDAINAAVQRLRVVGVVQDTTPGAHDEEPEPEAVPGAAA